MADSTAVKPKKKLKFPQFGKKEVQKDAFGNETKKKRRLFKYNRINRSYGGDLLLTLVLVIGGVFML